jgi:DmsE family decaheme c-type cytochrome
MGEQKGFFALVALIFLVAAAGCATVSSQSYEDYKAKVAARADAQLVGNETCWGCHKNPNHVHAEKGVQCESCHGPGDLAVKDLHEERGRMACNYKTFIDIGKLPKWQQSAMCMDCHSKLATFVLHNWNASAHNLNGVSCIDCHNIHHGDNLKPARADIDKLCNNCHQEVTAQFMLPTHHPLPEGKVTCTDCHNPHGSPNPGPMLVRETVKETCTRCHGEKEGPFVFEHADLMEDCTICHQPHGSVNDWLLAERQPYLCKQCHAPTAHDTVGAGADGFGSPLCTNCHSTIHGSDLDSNGEGLFLR